jgi:serine/threonine-protein kinase
MLQNRYRVVQKLGEGGFGKTFLAEDTHLPSLRKCVIKQLKPISDNPTIYQLIQERFKQEAVILENLGAENAQIPSLFAFFEEDNQFYLVQEYVEGTNLADLIKQKGVLSESEVREFLLKILPVLDFIHGQKIIHRDIKPDNLILRAQDKLPVLIDFGAVKETMGTIVSNSGTPTSSIIIGSPGFMPSEQSIGRPVYATDIYALGLTAIFLLSARLPSDLATNQETGEIEWRQYCPNVSSNLAMILTKAIAPHYQNRYLKAKEMLNALQTPAVATMSLIQTEALQDLQPNLNQNQTLSSTRSLNPNINNLSDQGLKPWLRALITGGMIGIFILLSTILIYYLVSPNQTVNQNNDNNNNKSSEINNQQSSSNSNDIGEKKQNEQIPLDLSSELITTNEAINTINNLYSVLSSKQFNEARQYYSAEIWRKFDPDFFAQFELVTVDNLQVISKTPKQIDFIGENTYFYYDGSIQREKRSYTVGKINGQPKITASEFIKVIKFK